MAGWVPAETILSQIVQLLKESHSPDTEIQRSVEQVWDGVVDWFERLGMKALLKGFVQKVWGGFSRTC